MIISVEDLRKLLPEFSDISDAILETKLQAIEGLIRSYTNNNFQRRGCRFSVASDTALLGVYERFNVSDTVQITESDNSGLYIIKKITDGKTILDRELFPSADNLVTLVKYPLDVIIGAVNMLKWDLDNRAKVGIQSETLSRHSVTYFNMDGENSLIGYPKSLTGFLKPYMKARF